VHRLPREVLRKTDRHRTSTKFRLRVIRWVHELFKRPSYNANRIDQRFSKSGRRTGDGLVSGLPWWRHQLMCLNADGRQQLMATAQKHVSVLGDELNGECCLKWGGVTSVRAVQPFSVIISAMLRGSLSPLHGTSSGCGRRRRPPSTESSCEHDMCLQSSRMILLQASHLILVAY
jgi:hypothetical protein